jgi:hypothetical protein
LVEFARAMQRIKRFGAKASSPSSTASQGAEANPIGTNTPKRMIGLYSIVLAYFYS